MALIVYLLIQQNVELEYRYTVHDTLEDALQSAELLPWGNTYHIEEHYLDWDSLVKYLYPEIPKSGPSKPAKVNRRENNGS